MTFKTQLPTIEDVLKASSTYMNFPIEVEGFWSSPITLSISETGSWDCDEKELKIEVTHSSGGYEGTDRFPAGPLQAERNFAQALMDTLNFAEEIREHTSQIKACVAQARAEWAAEREAERARQAAKKEADPAMTKDEAESLLNSLRTRALRDRYAEAEVRHRGQTVFTTISAKPSWNDKMVFFAINDVPTARNKIIDELISEMSSEAR